MRLRFNIAIILAAMFMLPVRAAADTDTDALERYLLSEAGSSTGMDMTNIYGFFQSRKPSAVEGLWRMSGSDGTFALVGDEGSIFYRLIVIDSEDLNVAPGDVMGVCTAAGRKNSYDARIFTSVEDGKLTSPKRFTITLSDDGHLIIVPVNNHLRFNLWRMVPYMFRAAVTRVNDRPNNLDGALRIYPEPADSPFSPRCL